MKTEQVPIASPCIGICRLDDRQVCSGCFRSMAEISRWPYAGEHEKRAIVAAAERRRAVAPPPANS